jgi:hypothetical protein
MLFKHNGNQYLANLQIKYYQVKYQSRAPHTSPRTLNDDQTTLLDIRTDDTNRLPLPHATLLHKIPSKKSTFCSSVVL